MIKSEEVARYLKERPEFFEQYADLVAGMHIPHPHGGRAISISERQILSLRDKNRALELKLEELIQTARDNEMVDERLHRMTVALTGARDLEVLRHALYFNLREDFAVPHVALRMWPEGGEAALAEFREVSAEARAFAKALTSPQCTHQAVADTADWFGHDPAQLRSFAYVALRQPQPFGLLALASEDAQRFYPEMGTHYLRRLGDAVSAAFSRYFQIG
ncbi:MAG: DUF484 family protein [Burkholderiales bacterium]|nr:DUF484 family protein [Pseudomonadota bacterium]